jgi:hypothetical protein
MLTGGTSLPKPIATPTKLALLRFTPDMAILRYLETLQYAPLIVTASGPVQHPKRTICPLAGKLGKLFEIAAQLQALAKKNVMHVQLRQDTTLFKLIPSMGL